MQNSVGNLDAVSVPTTLRLGTRTSQLALWQTNHVVAQLQRFWPRLHCDLIHLVTQGDKRLDRPLPEIGGKGLFTAELEEALRRGEIDIAVHSLKDLPVEDPPDLMIGAILSREDTRDVLVAREPWTLDTLPEGAVVGTSSLRRQAQLLAARPDLKIRSIRGNVDTRLRKVLSGEYDAAVMAGAGLTRLGLTEHITQWLDQEVMLPAPGQGALAIQCRANDPGVHKLLAAIHDPIAAATTIAERQLLFRLGGGCSAPIGAWARSDGEQIELHARVTSIDGRAVFDARASGKDASQLAQEVADVLLRQGAQEALQREVNQTRTVPTTSALTGKRVVVTRPRHDDKEEDELTALLRQAGALPVEIPAIRLVPTTNQPEVQQAIQSLDTYDWIIFTSANAVQHFWAQDAVAGLVSQGKLPQIAAVGPATRTALEKYGVPISAMPERFIGTEIVNTLGDLTGKRVLLPRSAQGGRELPALLAEQGATVTDVPLYTPEAAPIEEDARRTLANGVDIVTFASGSAVRAFASVLRGDPRFDDFWSKVVVACIGPSTAEVVRLEGLPVHIIAEEHSVPGLVNALREYYQKGS